VSAQMIEPTLEAGSESADPTERLINRIGTLTRTLRDSMRELGLDKQVERAAEAIPDARDRLKYVASMTEQAAERALNAIEIAMPIQESIKKDAGGLDQRWKAWFDEPLGADEARSLVMDTRGYLQEVGGRASETNSQLMEIMMAQDFQDLTGQVIKKIMDLVYNIEQQLLGTLLESLSPEKRLEILGSARPETVATENGEHLLNGPQINPEGRSDVVADQDQVDDLLTSLGF
jgi:chemotaxis protein CheZ